MKKTNMKTFLMRHEKPICLALQCGLCMVVILRLLMVYMNGIYPDARVFVDTANLIRQGINPYTGGFGDHAIQAPTMSILAMPLCFCTKNARNTVMFVLGAVSFILYCLMAFRAYGFGCRQCVAPRWRHLPIWFVLACLFISSPISGMLRIGQNSSIAAVLLFAALLHPSRDNGPNVLFLGLSAAVKYSLMTMLAPVLVLQKRWKMSLLAFGLFAIMLLCLGFWVDNVFLVLRDYVTMCAKSTTGGGNSYNVHAFYFLSIGFLKIAPLNSLLKYSLLVMYVCALVRIWRGGDKTGEIGFPGHLTATDWGLLTVITMLVSYHRIQDAILFMPFIGIMFLESFYEALDGRLNSRAVSRSLVLLALVVFWTLPSSMVFAAGSWIGKRFPGGERYFFYTDDAVGGFYHIFPLMPCVLLAMAVFFFWLEFRGDDRKPQDRMLQVEG